ncbi:MAG: hypothetical protein CBD18_05210 [Opitutales bacterium TMED158]|nr:MAG: hypothetical protein CBD18_05210 [Opitutales bacterium TMED158]
MLNTRVFPTALALSLCVFSSFAESKPQQPSHWTESYVVANGIRIHYWRTGGDKPPLIMTHGYSDDGLCWTAIAQELEDRYDVFLPDARGHGLSDPNSPNDPTDIQVEDIRGFIEALELDKPIVVGHSMGASSAAWFAARYPDTPRAVVLVDPRLVSRPSNGNAESSAADRDRRAAQTLQRNNTSYQELIDSQMAKNPHWGIIELHFWALSKQRYHPNTAYRSSQGRPDMSELFKKTVCPTLILKADDQGKLREQNKEVSSLLKDGQLVHVKDARHSVHRDQKQRFLEALDSFLDRVSE